MRNLNKDQVRFEKLQARLAAADEIVATFIEQQGAPSVIFHIDLYKHIMRQGQGGTLAGLLVNKTLRRMMAAKGYDVLSGPEGGLWKRGDFRSHTAFVLREITPEDRAAVVRSELENRGS